MNQNDLRGTLLATSSALALFVGLGGTAQAAPAGPCTFNNDPGAGGTLTTTGTNNCISYNNSASTTVNVINNGTLNPPGTYPPTNAGTATGISVIKTTTLNGSITNNGSINVIIGPPGGFAGINVGGGSFPPGTINSPATVTGSIINNGTINGGAPGTSK